MKKIKLNENLEWTCPKEGSVNTEDETVCYSCGEEYVLLQPDDPEELDDEEDTDCS